MASESGQIDFMFHALPIEYFGSATCKLTKITRNGVEHSQHLCINFSRSETKTSLQRISAIRKIQRKRRNVRFYVLTDQCQRQGNSRTNGRLSAGVSTFYWKIFVRILALTLIVSSNKPVMKMIFACVYKYGKLRFTGMYKWL